MEDKTFEAQTRFAIVGGALALIAIYALAMAFMLGNS